MTIENTGVALARQATEALRALGEYGPHLAPGDADRFGWSADVLDELARVASVLVRAVESTVGEASDGVADRADDLATAIVAHRNSLLRPGHVSDGGGADRAGGHVPAATGVAVRGRQDGCAHRTSGAGPSGWSLSGSM